MSSKKFSEAMSELGSKYVDEAVNYKKKAKKPVWVKWGAAAACLAAVIAIGMFIPWQTADPTPPNQTGEVMAETSNLNIYCLSERNIIEAKSVEVSNTPKDIFDKWAALNHLSDVTFIDCVYDGHGTESLQEGSEEHSAGNFHTLSLRVSGEFSKYASGENGVFLLESLRRTFYDYISFDEMNLIIESLTVSAVSNGIAEPDMQADDGKILVWEGMSEKEICGTKCYAFELRYSEDENINGEMAGRLLGIYAISNDGAKFYQYNMADDTWEQLQSAAINR